MTARTRAVLRRAADSFAQIGNLALAAGLFGPYVARDVIGLPIADTGPVWVTAGIGVAFHFASAACAYFAEKADESADD